MLVVDERRLPRADAMSAAALIAAFAGRSIVSESRRRAIVRRIAATREDVALPTHIRRSSSFAARVLDALDRNAVPALFEPLAGHVRTLFAFADALDARSALGTATRDATVMLSLSKHAPARPTSIELDSALLDNDEDLLAWRRFAAAAGIPLETVALGPLIPPALDLRALAGARALLRYADHGRDADVRAALATPISGVPHDEACALLAAAGDRAPVLEVIARGATPAANRFAQGLNTLHGAYRAAGSTASTVIAAMLSSFAAPDDLTIATMRRIADDFDAACAFATGWDAHDLIAEFDAELDGVALRAVELAFTTPAAEVAAEPPTPVATRKLTFSASSLNAFAECERKWWFRYACAAVEDKGSAASFYGIAFHAALEDFHGVHTRFDNPDEAALAAFLDGCVVAAFDRARTRFDAPVAYELQKRRARRTAKRYISWLLERARKAPFEVIGNETPIDVELEGHRFVGFVDRLDRDDRTGTVTVVDYKTGAIATSADEYLEDVRAFHEFQLPFYYWARSAQGDVVSRLSLIPLKDALLDVQPIELEVVTTSRPPRSRGAIGEISVTELERARVRMIALAGSLSSGKLAQFPATTDPEACRYCAYTDACRERPRIAEERFAR
jgi:RecB family exonuclease